MSNISYIKDGEQIARYKLEFETHAESYIYDITGVPDASGTALKDFWDSKINFLGKEYTIVLAQRQASYQNPTILENTIKLTLMTGLIKDTLLEGESDIYDVTYEDDYVKSYNVELTYMDDDEGKFKVNDESTSKLKVGETFVLSDKSEIGVSKVTYEEGEHSVEFFLGAEKITLRDNDITNTVSDDKVNGGLYVGSESIDGAYVIITGTDDNNLFTISSIEINMIAEDDYYVGAGGKLSDAISNAGEEHEVLFANNWDFEYLGLTEEVTHDIELKTSSDKRYELRWYDGGGNEVNMPLVYALNDGTVVLGEEDIKKALILKENIPIRKYDYIVLTGGNPEEETAKSYLLQYKGADRITKTTPRIKFKNVGTGETLEYILPGTNPIATINLGGYSFIVEYVSDMNSDDFEIFVDLNNDGTIEDDQVPIIDGYGAQISVGNYNVPAPSTPLDTISLTITTPNSNDYDNKEPSGIKLTLGATSNNDVTVSSFKVGVNNALLTPKGEENIAYGYTGMGGKITYETPPSSPNLFTYSYPEKQRLPQLRIVAGIS